MNYIFGLGLFFTKYKGHTTIRIFSDDIMIDELILDDDIDSKQIKMFPHIRKSSSSLEFDPVPFTEPIPMPEHNKIFDFPKKIFLYEINESILGKKIYIELDDKNSNYTNGFMSKSNQIMIHRAFLLPKDLLSSSNLSRFTKFLRRRCVKNAQRISNNLNYDLESSKYLSWPATNFFNIENGDRLHDQSFGGKIKILYHVCKKFKTYLIYSKDKNHNNITILDDPGFFLQYCYNYNLINRINENH